VVVLCNNSWVVEFYMTRSKFIQSSPCRNFGPSSMFVCTIKCRRNLVMKGLLCIHIRNNIVSNMYGIVSQIFMNGSRMKTLHGWWGHFEKLRAIIPFIQYRHTLASLQQVPWRRYWKNTGGWCLGVDGNSDVQKVAYKTGVHLKSNWHHVLPNDRKRTRSSQKFAKDRKIFSGLFVRSPSVC